MSNGKSVATESPAPKPGKEPSGREDSRQATTNAGAEKTGFLNKIFTFGSQEPFTANDASDAYAEKGYYLRLKHIRH
mgnify:CR=1 FL=1